MKSRELSDCKLAGLIAATGGRPRISPYESVEECDAWYDAYDAELAAVNREYENDRAEHYASRRMID